MELLIEALPFACSTKWRFSYSETNARQAICERHSAPKLRDAVQRLCAPIVLTDPTKSQRPAYCFTMRSKFSQHKYKDCAVFLGCALTLNSRLSKMRSQLFLFDPASPSSASGAWPARTKPRKTGLLPARPASDVTPINHQLLGRDFAAVTLGGGAST